MKILFLGGNLSKSLSDWLISIGEEVIYLEQKIDINFVKKINTEFIISYNYRYIVSKDILKFINNKIINLHISYLPFNRGAHPNVWSFLDNTPKGVTIHNIDEGIDTGDIIVQKEVQIDENNETLKSSYKILNENIQVLFKENWLKIKKGAIKAKKQNEIGTLHYKYESSIFEPLIDKKGWDTSIKELKGKYEYLKFNSNSK